MKKSKIICLTIGTVLLIAALSIVLYNFHQDKEAGEYAQSVLAEIKSEIPQDVPEPATEAEPIPVQQEEDLFAEYETAKPVPEAVTVIDGNSYIGFVSIPSLDIELPVMSSWDYDKLKLSPCRYKGTAADGDLIIAAHNYRSHFGRISELDSGSEIIFTAADGKVSHYSVIQTETLSGTDIEHMEFGSDDNWDLTLFTCTLSGQSRVTVRAVLES